MSAQPASQQLLKAEDVLLFEQGTLRAPLDTLKKAHKTSLKTYEHNLGPSSSFVKDLNSLVTPGSVTRTAEEQLKTVEAMLGKMRGLKRKLAEISNSTTHTTDVLRTRMEYLSTPPPALGSPVHPAFARKRTSLQLADYFLRASPPMRNTAETLVKEEGLQDLVDFELWDELAKCEGALRHQRLEEALAWVGENRTGLKRLKSPLEFLLHLQAFIELCRQRSLVPAIAYSRKHLSTSATVDPTNTEQLHELNKAMALLAYGPDTTCIVYQELYASTRWATLQEHFRQTFLALHNLPSIPLLHLSLQAGLAALKTPSCSAMVYSDPAHKVGQSLECPVCTSPLATLAAEVPFSHHVNSTIVCRLSGKVVEGGVGDGGGLVALVSRVTGEGRVYSKEALLLRASKHPDGKLIDPETDEAFEWEEVKKVYIS